MKNTFIAIMMIVALFSSYLPARATTSEGVIVVQNNTGWTIRVTLAHQWTRGTTMESVQIDPGNSWHSAACCFAAGSPYVLVATFQDNGQETSRSIDFRPALCHKIVVPYGYEMIRINPSRNKIFLALDHTCPT